MARLTVAQAAEELYLALHNIVTLVETGKPLDDELLAAGQAALSQADRITQLRELAYPAGSDLV